MISMAGSGHTAPPATIQTFPASRLQKRPEPPRATASLILNNMYYSRHAEARATVLLSLTTVTVDRSVARGTLALPSWLSMGAPMAVTIRLLQTLVRLAEPIEDAWCARAL